MTMQCQKKVRRDFAVSPYIKSDFAQKFRRTPKNELQNALEKFSTKNFLLKIFTQKSILKPTRKFLNKKSILTRTRKIFYQKSIKVDNKTPHAKSKTS